MKLPLSAGEWLFTTSIIYFIIGIFNLFVYKFAPIEYIQMVWLLITALPLFIPMSKIVSVNTFWRM